MSDQIFNSTADTILEEPIKVSFITQPQTLLDRVKKAIGLFKGERTYYIRPLTLGTLMRISKEILKISIDSYSTSTVMDANAKVISEHNVTMVEIIALAIVNSKSKPSNGLKSELMFSLTTETMAAIVGVIIKQMNLEDFMRSIISIRGISILKEMSPVDQRRNIASGEQLEEL